MPAPPAATSTAQDRQPDRVPHVRHGRRRETGRTGRASNLWTKVLPVDSEWRMSDPVSTVAAMSMGVVTSWADRADRAYRVLIGRFWDGRRRLFRPSDRRRVLAAQWHYWWQAHALDACVDAVARTGSAEACRRVSDRVAGVQRRNSGRIENDYYDDMAWMGLALLRAEQLGLADAAGLVRRLWVAIRAGWDPRHGGSSGGGGTRTPTLQRMRRPRSWPPGCTGTEARTRT